MSVVALLLAGELVEVMACPSIGDVMDITTAARATSSGVLERFLASYWTTRTRANYRFILTDLVLWAASDLWPLVTVCSWRGSSGPGCGR